MMDRETYKIKLEGKYLKGTINQYIRAYDKHNYDWSSQEGIDKYCAWVLQEKNYNPLYIGALRAYLKLSGSSLVIPTVESRGKRLPKKDIVFLEKEEIDKVIRDSNPWVSILTRIYFDTGLRLNELVNITKDQIDIENRTIAGIGKGNKKFTVKYSPSTAMKLLMYIRLHDRQYPFKEYDDSTKDYGRSYWYHLKRECDTMGFKGVHPHSIRHSLGRYLLRIKKLDIMQVKVKLRHSSVESTQIYTESSQKEVDDTIDKEVFEDEGKDTTTEHII